MIDVAHLCRLKEIGYKWSIGLTSTGHYICRIWQDKIIDKQLTRTVYCGTFGDNLQDTIDECWKKFTREYQIHPSSE